MKTLKTTFLLAIILLLTPMISISQNNQSFWIHADQVKPSKQADYEQVAKDFIEACTKYNLKDSDWSTARIDDGTYLTITPISNMADLDKNTLAPLFEKMGEEKFRSIFKRFNECYDKHGDYIVTLNSDLSYMPNGLTLNTEGQNYRKWHFLYVTPSNSQALREKIKAIKDGKQVEFAKRVNIQIDKNHINGVTTRGKIVMTPHGFINDNDRELKGYKDARKDDWAAILGGGDFRVVEEDQAYTDITSFGEEPQ